MEDISEIRFHIKSIKQTRQVTKAMSLIASSKMKRAFALNDSNKAFAKELRPIIKDVILHARLCRHPCCSVKEPDSSAYIVICSDRGLAGPYNNDVLTLAYNHMKTKNVSTVFPIGRVGKEYLELRRMPLAYEFLNALKNISMSQARFMAETIYELFELKQFDEIFVVYTRMFSSFKQKAVIERILPFNKEDYEDVDLDSASNTEVLLHPSPQVVMRDVVQEYLVGYIYGCMVQAYASEQALRMRTMDTATSNADDMIKDLNTKLNRSRQEGITQEISEVVSGYLAQ